MDDDSKLPPIIPPAQHARYVGTSNNWRAPELPGVDTAVPPGVAEVAVAKGARASFIKIRRTFDNTKTVEAFRPYGELAEEIRDAVLRELADTGYPVGPSVSVQVDIAVRQDMWGRFLLDRALTADEKLRNAVVKVGLAAGAAAAKNISAAHKLHAQLRADEAKDRRVDPLAAFVEPKADP